MRVDALPPVPPCVNVVAKPFPLLTVYDTASSLFAPRRVIDVSLGMEEVVDSGNKDARALKVSPCGPPMASPNRTEDDNFQVSVERIG